jgi:hypothetical protein
VTDCSGAVSSMLCYCSAAAIVSATSATAAAATAIDNIEVFDAAATRSTRSAANFCCAIALHTSASVQPLQSFKLQLYMANTNH